MMFLTPALSLALLSLTALASAGVSQSKRADSYPCDGASTGDLCTLDGKRDYALSSIYDTFSFTARGEIGSNYAVEYVTLALQKANTTDVKFIGAFFNHYKNDYGIFEGENVKIPCGTNGGDHYLNIDTHTFSGVAETPSVAVKTFGPFNATSSC